MAKFPKNKTKAEEVKKDDIRFSPGGEGKISLKKIQPRKASEKARPGHQYLVNVRENGRERAQRGRDLHSRNGSGGE